ncbi:hypothetical protein HDU76_009124, partial [Blyttiomyces sp. JEL0837]
MPTPERLYEPEERAGSAAIGGFFTKLGQFASAVTKPDMTYGGGSRRDTRCYRNGGARYDYGTKTAAPPTVIHYGAPKAVKFSISPPPLPDASSRFGASRPIHKLNGAEETRLVTSRRGGAHARHYDDDDEEYGYEGGRVGPAVPRELRLQRAGARGEGGEQGGRGAGKRHAPIVVVDPTPPPELRIQLCPSGPFGSITAAATAGPKVGGSSRAKINPYEVLDRPWGVSGSTTSRLPPRITSTSEEGGSGGAVTSIMRVMVAFEALRLGKLPTNDQMDRILYVLGEMSRAHGRKFQLSPEGREVMKSFHKLFKVARQFMHEKNPGEEIQRFSYHMHEATQRMRREEQLPAAQEALGHIMTVANLVFTSTSARKLLVSVNDLIQDVLKDVTRETAKGVEEEFAGEDEETTTTTSSMTSTTTASAEREYGDEWGGRGTEAGEYYEEEEEVEEGEEEYHEFDMGSPYQEEEAAPEEQQQRRERLKGFKAADFDREEFAPTTGAGQPIKPSLRRGGTTGAGPTTTFGRPTLQFEDVLAESGPEALMSAMTGEGMEGVTVVRQSTSSFTITPLVTFPEEEGEEMAMDECGKGDETGGVSGFRARPGNGIGSSKSAGPTPEWSGEREKGGEKGEMGGGEMGGERSAAMEPEQQHMYRTVGVPSQTEMGESSTTIPPTTPAETTDSTDTQLGETIPIEPGRSPSGEQETMQSATEYQESPNVPQSAEEGQGGSSIAAQAVPPNSPLLELYEGQEREAEEPQYEEVPEERAAYATGSTTGMTTESGDDVNGGYPDEVLHDSWLRSRKRRPSATSTGSNGGYPKEALRESMLRGQKQQTPQTQSTSTQPRQRQSSISESEPSTKRDFHEMLERKAAERERMEVQRRPKPSGGDRGGKPSAKEMMQAPVSRMMRAVTENVPEPGAKVLTRAQEATEKAIDRHWTEDRRRELEDRFFGIIAELHRPQSKEARQAIVALIDMSQDSAALQALRDPSLNDAMRAGKTFIERLCSGASLDPIIDSFRQISSRVTKDPHLRVLIADIQDFVRRCATDRRLTVEHPEIVRERFRSLIQRARDALMETGGRVGMELRGRRGGEIDYEASQRGWEEQLRTIGKGLDDMITGYREDEGLSELTNAMTSVTNALFLDRHGSPVLKTALWNDFTNVFLPMLMEQVAVIPIPRLEYVDKDWHIVLEDIAIYTDNVIPKLMEVKMANSSMFGLRQNIGAETMHTLKVSMFQIHADVRDVPFYVHKKTGFPRVTDTGIANLLIDGQGITVTIKVDVDLESPGQTLRPLK